MRFVFMGTAELACPCLEALARLPGHEITAVITQPDRPKGRDLKLSPPPVKVTAQRLGLPVQQPEKIRDAAAIAQLQTVRPDLIVVVAYGQILPRVVLEIPPQGCINVHASLLPRWRGAAPIQYAIWHGDQQTGVTTMFVNEQMDAGDILLQRAEPIRSDDTAGMMHDRLAQLGAALLVETINGLSRNNCPRTTQDETQVTYARKIEKEQGRINWEQPATEIERLIRAFNPWPSAYTEHNGEILKVWKAEVMADVAGQPGELLENHVVGTSRSGLRLLEVQPAGKKRMSFEAFLHGHPLPVGTRLGRGLTE